MRPFSRPPAWPWLAAAALSVVACGRSEIRGGTVESSAGSGGAPPACSVDTDCAAPDACTLPRCNSGSCSLEALVCEDDGDACTADRCDPVLGCVHPSLVVDLDGDGVPGPRPGLAPGDANACGSDCDDRNPLAFPGNVESGCDGIDNDCNGVIDDGARYANSGNPPVRISAARFARAARASLAAGEDRFFVSYTGTERLLSGKERAVGLIKGIGADGAALFESQVSLLNADGYGGALAWSGEVLGSAWGDARQGGSYEIYFNRFTPQGEKFGPDLRITSARGFSLSPNLVATSSEFSLVWDDRRTESSGSGDDARIFGQRIGEDGQLIGGNLDLISDDPVAESPSLTLGPGGVGLVYTTLDPALVSHLGYRVFDRSLGMASLHSTPIGSDVDSPAVYLVGSQYVALWSVHGPTWGDAIWGASFDQKGQLTLAPRPLTTGAQFARTHGAVSLGGRLLMVWADDHDGNYELYWQFIGPDLSPLVPRQRLTSTPANTLAPVVAVGPKGQVGVVYDDWSDGSEQVYFTTIACAGPP